MAPDDNPQLSQQSQPRPIIPLHLRTTTTTDSTGSDSTPRSASPTGSPRSASMSLQAAATMNAGLQHESSRRSSSSSVTRNMQSPSTGRRRSTVLMNLHLNDPSVPGPGEMVRDGCDSVTRSPHHQRAPSLGELHQELESEQEAQVNRLLAMIRQEQANYNQLHRAAPGADDASAIAPGPGGAATLAHAQPAHSPSWSPSVTAHPRGPFDAARRSRTPSRTASPRLRSASRSAESDWLLSNRERDESAFYQAETQMLTRENQMLRLRIRELEKQFSERKSPTAAATHEPAQHSHLAESQSAGHEGPESRGPAKGT